LKLRDAFYFTAGVGFLALAKARNVLKGYTSPKPFEVSEVERCIAYDAGVVHGWLEELTRYTGNEQHLTGKNVLELGPGSDLGVGIMLLARGVKRYNACDVNDLVSRTPRAFYDELLKRLPANGSGPPQDTQLLAQELDKQRAGAPSLLNYVIRSDFDICAAVGNSTIDLVFSQAAFEHFDDIEAVVGQLSRACKPGAVMVAEIDLKTHSRWIRDRDPNNIYRFHPSIFGAFWFRGIPNRVRPYEYRNAFERNGWGNIQMRPLATTGDPTSAGRGLSGRFRSGINQMEQLSIMFCATKR
jgi:SAM-dependent methyltransferase